MSQLWQHPYVNVFKHFNLTSWKKSTKEGEVAGVMDKTMKCTVYKITGSIPAGNYIQLPKAQTQSLGLTGRYMYLLFKPVPTKYFVVHIDLATQDNLIVRVSFSNLFKEFKSTSTWLQFPFLCNASKGSVHAFAAVGGKDHSGPAPHATRWTVLCLDFNYILSMYLNRKFSYMKTIRLCANMVVKNIFTSDTLYDPGITLDQAKKAGLLDQGVAPMPREMGFPVLKGDYWHDHYDLIRFPSDGGKKPFDSMQYSSPTGKNTNNHRSGSPKRVSTRSVDVSKCVSDRVAMIHKLTEPKQKMKRRQVTSQLPSVGVDDMTVATDTQGEVHVFAHPEDEILVHQEGQTSEQVSKLSVPGSLGPRKIASKTLEPDPIMKLKRIIGFGGASFRDVLWSVDASNVVYPCHAVVIAMKISNGHQRFFIGHTDKVSCISLTGNSSLLASGQTGSLSAVRIWKFQTGECLAMCKTHVHSLHSLSFSHKGNVLCGVGKDGHGKNMVVIWDTSKVAKSREVSVMAKAHTDVEIVRMKVAAFDDTRMVSCGRDNIRLWRVKDGHLRSAPVNLGEHHTVEFTDVCFEAGYHADKDPTDRLVYACSRSGHIFEIELQKVSIQNVRRLLPTDTKPVKEKQTFRSGSGIGINCMTVNETFCVTGSDDGFLRLWPLDFAHVYLEAEHEGPVTAIDLTSDGLQILAGTAMGTLGTLDISTRAYTTVMRSHTARIADVAVDPYRKHMATVSEDHSIRVWDSETLQQLYDFSAPDECPCIIDYHPSRQVFACGFESGVVRVFNVQTTTMMAEHKQHRGKITGLVFSPTGDYLYSACSSGSLAHYDAMTEKYELLRLLGNTVARGIRHMPDILAISADGRRMAFIGPSEYTVCVVDAKSLDEVVRIDVTTFDVSNVCRSALDAAVRLYFAPLNVGHLIVITSSHKLLKFDARNGRIESEVGNIHRTGCSTLAVTSSGRHLATGGDKVIKIWDYNMKLDINFQVFIGHSENVSKILFTPDGQGLLSVGEAIYVWDFLASKPPSPTEGREYREKDYMQLQRNRSNNSLDELLERSVEDTGYLELPRRTPPRPISYNSHSRIDSRLDTRMDSCIEDLSSIHKVSNEDDDLVTGTTEREAILVGPELKTRFSEKHEESQDSEEDDDGVEPLAPSPQRQKHKQFGARKPGKKAPVVSPGAKREGETVKPSSHKHFQQREQTYGMAQRRYTAPPNQAGLKLKSVIGYNGNGRGNMVWHPDTGLFAYTCGCMVVVEDLNTGEQRHLTGHVEEISTMALQNDCQILASASGSFGLSASQICLWNLQEMTCHKVLQHHEHDIVSLAYSRDDRFLISVGDYRDCCVVVWSTYDYEILTSSRVTSPIHELKWDPYTVNEFASVGENGTVLFWLLDETTSEVCLNVHEAEVPEDLLQTHHMGSGAIDFTSMVYAGDSTLYASTNNGKVSAWDTRHNTCFMHWEADNCEIGALVCRGGRLLTGSTGRNLRMWSVVGVGEMRLPGEHNNMRGGGLTMEDEMNVDGEVVSLAFDEALDMGIVGTSSGTLWYINWPERTSIRLVSSHMSRVNGLSSCNSSHVASCANDGSLRVWSVEDREQLLQFQVRDQSCTCVAFAPSGPDTVTMTTVSNLEEAPVVAHQHLENKQLPQLVAGYSDGTVRLFDPNKVEMVLKMHPHAVSVTAITFSSDGRMIISGGSDGLIAVSSPTTGMTVRVINDHKGAPITNIDVTDKQDQDVGITAPLLWLATSADRRVSVWSADWSKDFCELVDWLTFPAPAFTPDGAVISKQDQGLYGNLPPSLAKFSPEEQDIIVYTGYGNQKHVQFYSLSQRKVVRTSALTHWSTCMDMSPNSLITLGANERLMKLMDYYEGSFQDFTGHNDSVTVVKFSPDSKYLFSVAHAEILIWEVNV
ncbi:WD repeat-containing protein 90-like isoform X4 [Argopecten irradians]|uniref:WD repeat-containing protein 90-like isoform X1 n=1 Tax=Argopecten irradians TaxID=31199 RepID=UPI0037203AD3